MNPAALVVEQHLNLLHAVSQKFTERMLDPTVVDDLEGDAAEGQRLFKELPPVTAAIWRKFGPLAMAYVMLERRGDAALRSAYLTGPDADLYRELDSIREQFGLTDPDDVTDLTAAWVAALMEVAGGGELTNHMMAQALKHPIGQYLCLVLFSFVDVWADAEARLRASSGR